MKSRIDIIVEKVNKLHHLAKEYRRSGDNEWERGYKEASSRDHQAASDIEQKLLSLGPLLD